MGQLKKFNRTLGRRQTIHKKSPALLTLTTAMPKPLRPRLIWDGDCEFCRIWIEIWHKLTGDEIEYTPYQHAAADYPHIPTSEFQAAVHLISVDGTHTTGAKAVFGSLSSRRGLRWMLALYNRLPIFRVFSEAAYQNVASHRKFYLRITQLVLRK